MKKFSVVSYYTVNTPYEKIVLNLTQSLLKFELAHDVQGIQSKGNWYKNTQYKAQFLLEMLDKHQENIIWVDADAIIQQYPVLFDTLDCDVGVHYRQWRLKKCPEGELLSGTLYLANNEKIKQLIRRWVNNIYESKDPRVYDQKILQFTIKESKDLDLKVHQLPATYCQIFDSMKDAGEPVIEHFQASRKNKRLIK